MKTKIEIGGIYSTTQDKSPRWVVSMDKVQVFYDVWWHHTNNWALRSHNGARIFFRDYLPNFERKAQVLGYENLTKIEIEKFGLNLPMNFCRYKNLKWGLQTFEKLDAFKEFCKENNLELTNEIVLNVATAVLTPYGPSGGMKKGVLVFAQNGKWFTEAEMIWKAYNVQSASSTNIMDGVGIHKLGWEKKAVSYYLGGYYDLADYLRMFESMATI